MKKAAIVDIDGILFKIEARLAHALAVYMASVPEELAHLRTKQAAERSDIYWQTVFRTDLLDLDILIEGAKEALDELERQGYQIFFVTSRPGSPALFEATRKQLHRNHLLTPARSLHMKPAQANGTALQIFTKTLKMVMVSTLVEAFDITTLHLVDDKEENCLEIVRYLALRCTCTTSTSLVLVDHRRTKTPARVIAETPQDHLADKSFSPGAFHAI